jgi:hypothetical protein
MAAELRLGLSGRALVFADGAPFCLICGRRPFARRTLPCRDSDYARRKSQNLNSILEWMNPALAYFNWRRKVSFSIDAPLCLRHFWRGLAGEFVVIGAFIAAAGPRLALVEGSPPVGPQQRRRLAQGRPDRHPPGRRLAPLAARQPRPGAPLRGEARVRRPHRAPLPRRGSRSYVVKMVSLHRNIM